MDLCLVSGGDDIKIWDCNDFGLVKQFNPHDQNISSLCWSHDNNLLASFSLHSEDVALTSMKTMGVSTLHSGPGCLCVDLNETSRYMLCGGSDGLISVWDLKSKKIRKTYKDHKGAVTCARFNHNTSSIASGSETGEIILYNVITGQGCRPLTTPRLQAIKQVQFNKFKRSLLGSVSDDGSVSLWDCNTRQLVNTFPSHRAPATGLSFSPINDILLLSIGLDKRITFQDTQSKKIVKIMAADSPLTSIDTLHDGVTVVVGSTRGKIFQYDLRMSSVPVKTLDAHKSSVQCLRFQNEVQTEAQSSKGIGSKQSKHRQLPVSPSSSNRDVAAASQPRENKAAGEGYAEDVFSPLREGFHEHSSRDTVDFQNSVLTNHSSQNQTNSAAEGYAGGVFSPLNDNTMGRSSSGLSPLARNSYPSFNEQRSSAAVQMDYNRINSQVHASPRLNSYPQAELFNGDQDGQPSPTRSSNQNVAATSFVPEVVPENLNNQSTSSSSLPQTSNGPVQSSSQKQVAFATDDSDPYAFLTNSDSSDSQTADVKAQFTSPSKKTVISPSIPRMHLDDSPGSVSGSSNTDHLKLLSHPRTPEGVNAESCAASNSVYSRQTENRPGGLEVSSQPLTGDIAQLTHIIRSVVREEFATMKRDIVNEVRDEIEDRTDQLHLDIINLQAEMLRQFQIHQTEMLSLLQQYSFNSDLISEIERLQDETKRLKRIF